MPVSGDWLSSVLAILLQCSGEENTTENLWWRRRKEEGEGGNWPDPHAYFVLQVDKPIGFSNSSIAYATKIPEDKSVNLTSFSLNDIK